MKIRVTSVQTSSKYDGCVGVNYLYATESRQTIDFKARKVVTIEGEVQEGFRLVEGATEESLQRFVDHNCEATFDSIDTPTGKFYFITKLELLKTPAKA